MRYVAALLALVVVVPLLGTGCQTISEHQRTAIGAGTGAAGGAGAGGLIGGDATGVVVGGLIGALAGGGVGYYLGRQDRTRTQAVAETGYYTVLTPQANQSNLIRETHEIRHDGVLVANPSTEVSRPNGTFTSALPIAIPAPAPRGAYEVTTTIASGDRLSRAAVAIRQRELGLREGQPGAIPLLALRGAGADQVARELHDQFAPWPAVADQIGLLDQDGDGWIDGFVDVPAEGVFRLYRQRSAAA